MITIFYVCAFPQHVYLQAHTYNTCISMCVLPRCMYFHVCSSMRHVRTLHAMGKCGPLNHVMGRSVVFLWYHAKSHM